MSAAPSTPSIPPGCEDDCGACPKCRKRDALLDREAVRLAARHGVWLEREDHKTGVCGDRFPSDEQRESVTDGQRRTRALREYGDALRLRLDSARLRLRVIRETRRSLLFDTKTWKRHLDVINWMTDGRGLTYEELAQKYGRKSKSTGKAIFDEVRQAASVAEGARGFVGRFCKKPNCPNTIEKVVGEQGGRPPEYCRKACKDAHNQSMARARARIQVSAKPSAKPLPLDRLSSGLAIAALVEAGRLDDARRILTRASDDPRLARWRELLERPSNPLQP